MIQPATIDESDQLAQSEATAMTVQVASRALAGLAKAHWHENLNRQTIGRDSPRAPLVL
jgi:hypothetical protein